MLILLKSMKNKLMNVITLAIILDITNSGIKGIYVGNTYLFILIIVLILPQSMYSKAKFTLPSS